MVTQLRERAQGRCHCLRLGFSHCLEDCKVAGFFWLEDAQNLEACDLVMLASKGTKLPCR